MHVDGVVDQNIQNTVQTTLEVDNNIGLLLYKIQATSIAKVRLKNLTGKKPGVRMSHWSHKV